MPHDHDDHAHHLLPSDPELKLKALERILLDKGLVQAEAIDEIIDSYAHKIGPHRGAELVARAWTDTAFKKQLFENTDAVLAEMGFSGRQGEHVVIVENTPECHNLVVCTLCSCYPWPLLGIPPSWLSLIHI